MTIKNKVKIIVIVVLVISACIPSFIIYRYWEANWFKRPEAPHISGICDEGGVIRFIISEPLSIWGVTYSLLDNGTLVEDNSISGTNGLCCGNLSEIYNSDLAFQDENGNPLSNLSFYDGNLDGRLTTGDCVVVRGINNTPNGPGKPGVIFKLETPYYYYPSTFCTVIINVSTQITNLSTHNPYNQFARTDTEIKTPDLTISLTDPALSHYPPNDRDKTFIGVELHNNDTRDISNIAVKFFVNNIKIHSKENISIGVGEYKRILAQHIFEYTLEYDNELAVKIEIDIIGVWSKPLVAYINTTAILLVPPPSG